MLKSVSDVIAAPTLEQFNAEGSPSLIGFWTGEVRDGKVIDYSGNGYDLDVVVNAFGVYAREFTDPDQVSTYRPGWLTLAPLCNATIPVSGTLLDTQGKHLIWTSELLAEGTLNDADLGSAWDFGSSGTYEGFMLGGQANQWYSRVKSLDPAVTTSGTARAVSAGSEIVIAAGFVPSGRLVQCVNGGTFSSHATTISTLTAQDGKFGFGVSASQERISIRNYQLWAFDSEPANLNTTVEWMSHNPGRLPPWLEGR